MNMRLLLGLGLVATLAIVDAATIPVGGGDGIWTFKGSKDDYNNWASKINFTVGDVLVFNFTTRTHDVATVTKAKYDECNGENPLALAKEGPASITLTTSGFNYFICTLQAGGHCQSGLRLAVNVTAATNGATPPPPIPNASPPLPSTPISDPSNPSPSPSYPSSATMVTVKGGFSFLAGLVGFAVVGMMVA